MTSPESESPGPKMETAALPAIPVAPVVPGPAEPPTAAAFPEPPASAFPELPVEPSTTSSGLPNPYGLPEIAVERPEVGVGGAFAGGLVLALILKRLAR